MTTRHHNALTETEPKRWRELPGISVPIVCLTSH